MSWPCFWTEPTGQVDLELRRWHNPREEVACPGPWGYHNASVPIGRAPERRSADGYLSAISVEEFDSDERWPTACASCGYEFTVEDNWQVNQEPIYRRPDTGDEWPMRTLPVGAMFDATWTYDDARGADGVALTVVLPPQADGDMRGHFWNVDGPATGPGKLVPHAWTRTGDPKSVPPTVSATPSIAAPDYHGYLTNGVLTDPV